MIFLVPYREMASFEMWGKDTQCELEPNNAGGTESHKTTAERAWNCHSLSSVCFEFFSQLFSFYTQNCKKKKLVWCL